MKKRSLAEWLAWQETLNPAEIDLGLDRVRTVARQLAFSAPADGVFTVAGTNGKGSTVRWLDGFLRAAGYRTGVYTSPHLQRYNERVVIDGEPVSDDDLLRAFEAVDEARGDEPLTYFEFGTLAAFWLFARAGCDRWILEVGLGGRLDAVNVVDPDYPVLTTVGLDHQAWLGDDTEAIGREKAGIFRKGRPAWCGMSQPPASVAEAAQALAAPLNLPERDWQVRLRDDRFDFSGRRVRLEDLPMPNGIAAVQVQNCALAMAVLEFAEPDLLADHAQVAGVIRDFSLPGRFQVLEREHQWVLDVAHNAQAAGGLTRALEQQAEMPTTVVLGLFADKQAQDFVTLLKPRVTRWVVCPVEGWRARSAGELAAVIRAAGVDADRITATPDVEAACAVARDITPAGGRVLVCGSFQVVGPAAAWLGLYS